MCARRVSEALAAVCSELGVAAVQCVEKEELQMLAHAAGAVVAAEIPFLTADDDCEGKRCLSAFLSVRVCASLCVCVCVRARACV